MHNYATMPNVANIMTSTHHQHLPLSGVFLQQSGQEAAGVLRDGARVAYRFHKDEFKQDLGVTVIERQSSTDHLIRHDARAPPVHRPAIVVVF